MFYIRPPSDAKLSTATSHLRMEDKLAESSPKEVGTPSQHIDSEIEHTVTVGPPGVLGMGYTVTVATEN